MKENLEVIVEDHGGIWLRFNASDGKSATLNIETFARAHVIGAITQAALEQWCEDRRREKL